MYFRFFCVAAADFAALVSHSAYFVYFVIIHEKWKKNQKIKQKKNTKRKNLCNIQKWK